jgi:predicted ester cyclase
MTTSAAQLPVPGSITRDPVIDAQRVESAIEIARRFYAFWDTGDAAQLEAAVARSFVDHTLPAGRPQGPEGPVFASAQFRAAVPDLRCEVEELVIAGDKVTARLRFRGTFTGAFGERNGSGEPIDFIAIDVLGIRDGQVTDNWHLEDNLTLMQQLGVIAE